MIMGSFIIINLPNTKRSAVALLVTLLLLSCTFFILRIGSG